MGCGLAHADAKYFNFAIKLATIFDFEIDFAIDFEIDFAIDFEIDFHRSITKPKEGGL